MNEIFGNEFAIFEKKHRIKITITKTMLFRNISF